MDSSISVCTTNLPKGTKKRHLDYTECSLDEQITQLRYYLCYIT